MNRRSLVAVVALAGVGLTACGASAPPAKELAVEVIDSMVADGTITDAEGECMRDKVAEYEGEMLDDIAERAAGNDATGLEELGQFQADLAACRASG